MGLKGIAAKWLARREMKAVKAWSDHPERAQERTFRYLCMTLAATDFGHDHGITALTTQEEWTQKVPLRDYEGIKPYIERIKEGEINVLWKGKPAYFCKTSGTTSGTKYIPMSEEGIKAQTRAARQALLAYIAETGNSSFTEGKMIFLQGSPRMTDVQGISVGRLSGIVAHHVPSYLQKNRMPSWKTNSIEDWEKKGGRHRGGNRGCRYALDIGHTTVGADVLRTLAQALRKTKHSTTLPKFLCVRARRGELPTL